MSYDVIFFDLDDTLYPSHSGLWEAIRARMNQYMRERLGLPAEQVPELRRHYFTTYGTTLRGLQIHYQVDADEYLAYVHDLPLHEFIRPDPRLRPMIASLPQQRWIFTNADANHARRVLQALDLQDCFHGVIDVRAIQFACKPEPQAYARALVLAGNPPPGRCVMIDDSPANLAPARQLGVITVLVRPDGQPEPAAWFTIAELSDLPGILPGLWNGSGSAL
jgi:putative hydrolase of the HAD superfamily